MSNRERDSRDRRITALEAERDAALKALRSPAAGMDLVRVLNENDEIQIELATLREKLEQALRANVSLLEERQGFIAEARQLREDAVPKSAHDQVVKTLHDVTREAQQLRRDAERNEERWQRLTDAMTRWGWEHCTTEVELIEQIDSHIKYAERVRQERNACMQAAVGTGVHAKMTIALARVYEAARAQQDSVSGAPVPDQRRCSPGTESAQAGDVTTQEWQGPGCPRHGQWTAKADPWLACTCHLGGAQAGDGECCDSAHEKPYCTGDWCKEAASAERSDEAAREHEAGDGEREDG